MRHASTIYTRRLFFVARLCAYGELKNLVSRELELGRWPEQNWSQEQYEPDDNVMAPGHSSIHK
jgi:hypothetical protein